MTTSQGTVSDWDCWFEADAQIATIDDWCSKFRWSIVRSVAEGHPMTDAAFACWIESAEKYAPDVVPKLREIYEHRAR